MLANDFSGTACNTRQAGGFRTHCPG
ncbi:hypothetical protein, partial [Mesorhizobium sp.]